MKRPDGTPDVRGQGKVDRHDGGVVPDPLSRLEEALAGSWRRIRLWRVPPGWSADEWWEEARAEGVAAALRAVRDHDPARGVPLGAFVYRRILAGVRTRYRQEWAYGLRCDSGAAAEASQGRPGDSPPAARVDEMLRVLLARLKESDRRLIGQLYWDGLTESEVARALGISHQAVSKRKRAILPTLRRMIEAAGGI
jgi:DNA-directed RNA polymerase specialized sigma24 family protein